MSKLHTLITCLRTISRRMGNNMAKALAYVLRSTLTNPRTGRRSDFRRRGGCVATLQVNFNGTAQDFVDMCELQEKRCDSVVGRELMVALPRGLSQKQQTRLFKRCVAWWASQLDLAIFAALHAGGDHPGTVSNPHMHILFSPRLVTPDARGRCSNEHALNSRPKGSKIMRQFRSFASELFNLALHRQSPTPTAVFSSLSHEKNGVITTPTMHEGPTVTALRRKGVLTALAKENDRIREENARILAQHEDFVHALEAGAFDPLFLSSGNTSRLTNSDPGSIYELHRQHLDHSLTRPELLADLRSRVSVRAAELKRLLAGALEHLPLPIRGPALAAVTGGPSATPSPGVSVATGATSLAKSAAPSRGVGESAAGTKGGRGGPKDPDRDELSRTKFRIADQLVMTALYGQPNSGKHQSR